MRWIVAFVLLLGLAGCNGPAMKTTELNGYQVELLFEVDDCKVYRFQDGGNHHYFVTRVGSETMSPRSKRPDERIPTR